MAIRPVTGNHRKGCSDCGHESWTPGEYYIYDSAQPWGSDKYCLDCAYSKYCVSGDSSEDEFLSDDEADQEGEAAVPLKVCFWSEQNRCYDWTGASAKQLRLKNADVERAMQAHGRGGGLLRDAAGYCLRDAAASGNVVRAQHFLTQGANPNFDSTQYPLALASFYGHAECVRLLLDAKAYVDHGASYQTPLLVACNQGHDACAGILLASGATIHGSVWAKDDITPLQVSCQKGHVKCAQLLIDAKAPVNLPSVHCQLKGATPLFQAALGSHAACVTALLAAKADTTHTIQLNGKTMTALQIASLSSARQRDLEAVVALLTPAAPSAAAEGPGGGARKKRHFGRKSTGGTAPLRASAQELLDREPPTEPAQGPSQGRPGAVKKAIAKTTKKKR